MTNLIIGICIASAAVKGCIGAYKIYEFYPQGDSQKEKRFSVAVLLVLFQDIWLSLPLAILGGSYELFFIIVILMVVFPSAGFLVAQYRSRRNM